MSSSSGDLVATGIPTRRLYDVWTQAWPLIEPAYRRFLKHSYPEKRPDILAGLLSKDLQLWLVYDNLVPVSGIVSRLLREGTSGELTCHLWLVGGSRLSDWSADFLSILIPWAKAEGCTAITGNGRKGWARIVARHGGERIEDREGLPCWRLAI